jgi:hypothetical protein
MRAACEEGGEERNGGWRRGRFEEVKGVNDFQ